MALNRLSDCRSTVGRRIWSCAYCQAVAISRERLGWVGDAGEDAAAPVAGVAMETGGSTSMARNDAQGVAAAAAAEDDDDDDDSGSVRGCAGGTHGVDGDGTDPAAAAAAIDDEEEEEEEEEEQEEEGGGIPVDTVDGAI